jgi:hypothetical protein
MSAEPKSLGVLLIHARRRVNLFMWKHHSLSRQHLILVSTIALLTACSQQSTRAVDNLKSLVPNTATASLPSTLTSVKQKPLVTQQADNITSESPTALRSCRAQDLQAAVTDEQGAVGSRYAIIKFTNQAKTACLLQGNPQIEILDSKGRSLPVRGRARGSDEDGSKVIVQPGQQASLPFTWTNWCHQGDDKIKFVVNLPRSQGRVNVPLPANFDNPPCLGNNSTSSLSVGSFKAMNSQ